MSYKFTIKLKRNLDFSMRKSVKSTLYERKYGNIKYMIRV